MRQAIVICCSSASDLPSKLVKPNTAAIFLAGFISLVIGTITSFEASASFDHQLPLLKFVLGPIHEQVHWFGVSFVALQVVTT